MVPNDITIIRRTYRRVRNNDISKLTLLRRGCIILTAFTGGMLYQRVSLFWRRCVNVSVQEGKTKGTLTIYQMIMDGLVLMDS